MKTCPLSELEQESAVELVKKYTTAAGKPKQCKKMLDHDTVQAQPTLPGHDPTVDRVERSLADHREIQGGALRRFMLAQSRTTPSEESNAL